MKEFTPLVLAVIFAISIWTLILTDVIN